MTFNNDSATTTTIWVSYRRNVSGSIVACGSKEVMELVAVEANTSRTNFINNSVTYCLCILCLWITFGIWHGLSKCAYWKSIQNRYLLETRIKLRCCNDDSSSNKGPQDRSRADIRNNAIDLLIWRSAMFILFFVPSWFWGYTVYYLGNLLGHLCWVYFLAGIIVSARGIYSINVAEKDEKRGCFAVDIEGPVDCVGIMFVVFYEIISVSIVFTVLTHHVLLGYSDGDWDEWFYQALTTGPINLPVVLLDMIFTVTPCCWANVAIGSMGLQFYLFVLWANYWLNFGCYPFWFLETNGEIYDGASSTGYIWMIILTVIAIVVYLIVYGIDAAANACFKKCYHRQMESAHCCRPKHEKKIATEQSVLELADASSAVTESEKQTTSQDKDYSIQDKKEDEQSVDAKTEV